MDKLPVSADLLAAETDTVADAIRKMNENSQQVVCVVDDTQRLLGIVNDGDIRRKLLDGIGLDSPLSEVMNRSPLTSREQTSSPELQAFLLHNKISQVPIVDEGGILVGLVTQQSLLEAETRDNWVVILAGGLGSRLQPLTKDTPKPLLPVDGRPIIEIVLRNFALAGFWKFFISVNYLGEQIKDYLGDGSTMNVSINYLEEAEPTGTAGCLALLPERPSAPFFVMNADILTNIDLAAMLKAHEMQRPAITVASRIFEQKIDFGVLVTEGNRLVRLQEKPVDRYQVNAGIYVVSPEVLSDIGPEPCFVNMTDIINRTLQRNGEVHTFAVHEYWRDIGRPDDLHQASRDYQDVFAGK